MIDIKKIYESVVSGCTYDLAKASQHTNALYLTGNVTAAEMPEIEAAFVAENHVGCCLHYGMTLFYRLRLLGIECYISMTKEENHVTHEKTDNHVSVCYVQNGHKFIADPVETVKTHGEKCFYDIPIEEFLAQQGTIRIYDPYGEHGGELFFEEFLAHPIEVLEVP